MQVGTERRLQVVPVDGPVLNLGHFAGVLDDRLDVRLWNVAVDVGQIRVHLDEFLDGQRRAALVVFREDDAQLLHRFAQALQN